MKRLIFNSIFLVVYCSNLFAQIEKGAMTLEGLGNFSVTQNKDEIPSNNFLNQVELKASNFSFRPMFGYFITNSIMLGLGVSYEQSKLNAEYSIISGGSTTITNNSNALLINPSIRKFVTIRENIYFTTSLNMLIGNGTNTYSESEDNVYNTFNYRFNISPGLTCFVSDRLAIMANFSQLFYSRQRERLESDANASNQPKNISVDYGISASSNTFTVGLQYFVKHKK